MGALHPTLLFSSHVPVWFNLYVFGYLLPRGYHLSTRVPCSCIRCCKSPCPLRILTNSLCRYIDPFHSLPNASSATNLFEFLGPVEPGLTLCHIFCREFVFRGSYRGACGFVTHLTSTTWRIVWFSQLSGRFKVMG